MKKVIVLLLLLPIVGFAQEGKPIKSIAIPRTDTPLPDKKPEDQTEAPQYSISKPFEPKMFKSPKKVYEAPQLENQIGMGNQPKSDLKPGASYEKKLNKQFQKEGTGDAKMFRRDQYFGEFVTESSELNIYYKDFGLVDGDRIRIWADGKVWIDALEMDAASDYVKIGLIMGINVIEIEALNEGVYFPNTGEFSFVDEDKKIMLSERWYLATGFKGRFNVLRVAKGSKVK